MNEEIYRLLGQPQYKVESILEDNEMDKLCEAYYKQTGDLNEQNISQVLKDAATIRILNTLLDLVMKGLVLISLDEHGELEYHIPSEIRDMINKQE